MASQTLSPTVYCGSPSVQGSAADITQFTTDPFKVGTTSYYRTVLKFRTPDVDITGTGSLKVSITCTDSQYLHRFMAAVSATLVCAIGDISNSNSQGLNSKVTNNAIKVIDALSTEQGTSFTLDFGSGFAPDTDYYVYLVRNTTSSGNHNFGLSAYAANVSATYEYTEAPKVFTLSISQGTGSTATVKRNGTGLSNGASINYGDILTITYGASTGYNLVTHTVNGSAFASGGNHTVTGDVAVVATASLKTFKLSISDGTGAVISVKRNGTALSNGATLTYGDEITITFEASAGYELTYTSHTSGDSYTVTADVSVSATATVLSYLLSISQGQGTTVMVKRTSSPKQGASTGSLSDGATVYYSDVLDITITAKDGYKLSSATVNGSAFYSGNSHTVTGAVNVAAVALLYAYLIGSGSIQRKYVAQIKRGGVEKTYVGYIKQGGGWNPCGQ